MVTDLDTVGVAKQGARGGVAAAEVAGQEARAWDGDEVAAEVSEEAREACRLAVRHQPLGCTTPPNKSKRSRRKRRT
jgi:hypothetical protein